MGRNKREESKVITVPANKIEAVKKLLGRRSSTKQAPTIRIRVPVSKIEEVREIIKDD